MQPITPEQYNYLRNVERQMELSSLPSEQQEREIAPETAFLTLDETLYGDQRPREVFETTDDYKEAQRSEQDADDLRDIVLRAGWRVLCNQAELDMKLATKNHQDMVDSPTADKEALNIAVIKAKATIEFVKRIEQAAYNTPHPVLAKK